MLRSAYVSLVADLRYDEVPPADIYVHAAAYIDVEESWVRPFEYVVNNAAVTAKLSRIAMKRGVFLIYVSSSAVYGEPVYLPIDEEHPTWPVSPYGLTKLWGEQIAAMYVVKLAIIRPFNVYRSVKIGPYAGVVAEFVRRALQSLPLIIHGDGTQTRDFVHVEDLVDFVAIVVEKEAAGIYNVGSGSAVSIMQLAQLVERLVGSSVQLVFTDPRPGDIKHSVADISRSKKLGWVPRRKLEVEIEKLISAYGSLLKTQSLDI